MIVELLEQLLLAALIDHAAREVLATFSPAPEFPVEKRHSFACGIFHGGGCSCY